MRKSVEVYVPVLFKFGNDEIVFSDAQVKKMKDIVFSNKNNFKKNSQYKSRQKSPQQCFEYIFIMNTEKGQADFLLEEQDAVFIRDARIEIYYYHHRMIIKYAALFSDADPKSRSLRVFINRVSQYIIENLFIKRINQYIKDSENQDVKIDLDGLILMYYSYIIMLTKTITIMSIIWTIF